jgi:aspartyl protease family protein
MRNRLFIMLRPSNKMLMRILFCISFLCLTPHSAWAVKAVSVQGLFKNKAVLLVDGARHVLKVGQLSPEGVKLIAIEGDTAVLQINGKRRRQRLGENMAFATQYAESVEQEVLINKDNRGLFTTVGAINGFTVNFLVDTGANVVSMNAAAASRLGIDYQTAGQPVMVATASGVVRAYRVTLQRVAVGDIALHNIEAVVMEGAQPAQILLGMSFLGNLEMQRNGNMMRLKKTF